MKIWKSVNLSDSNIYCYYDDLVRLSEHLLPEFNDLNDSNYPPFGLGFLNDADGALAQSDGMLYVHQKYPKSRPEIDEALDSIGFTVLLNAIVYSNKINYYSLF